ncbi:hypothetical protein [Nocardia suismassiliense]|uniref:hypothetical protein n=1 Tax=Nocardia suismassiliense TaxID=2077092 RepID=UPI000D1F150B|nr:hypothetical protein [Nocardia suismassiliense]
MVLSRNVALRLRLAAELANADGPLSTAQLQDAINGPGWRGRPNLYNQLRALENLGLCARQPRRPDEPNVYWLDRQKQAMADAVEALNQSDAEI